MAAQSAMLMIKSNIAQQKLRSEMTYSFEHFVGAKKHLLTKTIQLFT
jgi:hypothetical protein